MDKVKCPYCNKEYSKNGIGTHIWRNHGNGKTHDPNKGYKDGSRKIWNKGLNAENHSGVKSQSEKIKGRKSAFEGKSHSAETKENLSQIRIKYLTEHPDQVPYRLNHSSKKSYPEKLFEAELKRRNIKGWIYNYPNGIYQYDFAWPALKIDVEIDGSTHKQKKVIKIDERRDIFSKEQGWKVIRFEAKKVKENINECINDLLEYLV